MIRLMVAFGLMSSVTPVQAQTAVFHSDIARKIYYRIPTLVSRKNQLLYLGDDRSGVTDATAWGDIGSEGNISIVARKSKDNGKNWQPTQVAVKGHGDHGFDKGHGDAAVVWDAQTGRLLLLCASGEISYGQSDVRVRKEGEGDKATYTLDLSKAQRVGRYYSEDGGKTWQGEEITASIYSLFDEASEATYDEGRGKVPVERLFFASGRICQSKQIRTGKVYRIYSVLTTNQGSIPVYSDDFGQSWLPLGGAAARPAPRGDEAKIAELPDGSVLLSCRMRGGRYFNIYTYTDAASAQGSWTQPVASTSLEGGTAAQNNATNGEILIVPAQQKDGKRVHVALQTVPFGNTIPSENNSNLRSHVSVYWKVLASPADYASPSCFLNGWTRYELTDGQSAYSTMTVDGKGRIAFAYEDNCKHLVLGSRPTDMYDLMFRTLSLQEITGGAVR